jgi:hypothetical protein
MIAPAMMNSHQELEEEEGEEEEEEENCNDEFTSRLHMMNSSFQYLHQNK